jgi:hypothetical protein
MGPGTGIGVALPQGPNSSECFRSVCVVLKTLSLPADTITRLCPDESVAKSTGKSAAMV